MRHKYAFSIVREYIWRYRKPLLILTCYSILIALFAVILPISMSLMYDKILKTPSVSFISTFIDTIGISALGLLFVYQCGSVLRMFVSFLSDKLELYIARKLDFDFRTSMLTFILRLQTKFFADRSSGSIENKIRNASEALDVIIGRTLARYIPDALTIVLAFVVCYIVEYRLALIMTLGVIIYTLYIISYFKKLSPLQKTYLDTVTETQGYVLDVIQNSVAVKDASAEEYESTRVHNKFLDTILTLRKEVIHITAQGKFWGTFIRICSGAAVFAIGIMLIDAGQFSVGKLIMFSTYLTLLLNPILDFGFRWESIQNGLIALDTIEEYRTFPTERNPEKEYTEITGPIEKIVFDSVSFSYDGTKQILSDIDLSVHSGEIVGFVGKTGGGKSTLMKLLSAHYAPTEGKIMINGIDLSNIDPTTLRKKIAVVPQDILLFNDTIEANIAYGSFDATHDDIVQAAELARALDFIEAFPDGWSQIVGERGIRLSGGQKQRVALARALLRKPEILILDEPTSALDAETEYYIREAIENIATTCTIFIIAHRLSTVQKANRIYVLLYNLQTGYHFLD